MLVNLDDIQNNITQEKMDVLVVSYGGSATNALVDALIKNKYNIKTHTYNKVLCHFPHYIDLNIPIIYVYDNPTKSFLSVKRRHWAINQKKLSNDEHVKLSDENLLKLMINQFMQWTTIPRKNVLIVKTCELFNDNIVDKLQIFLNRKIDYFPLVYKSPATDVEKISQDINIVELFDKYKTELQYINDFAP